MPVLCAPISHTQPLCGSVPLPASVSWNELELMHAAFATCPLLTRLAWCLRFALLYFCTLAGDGGAATEEARRSRSSSQEGRGPRRKGLGGEKGGPVEWVKEESSVCSHLRTHVVCFMSVFKKGGGEVRKHQRSPPIASLSDSFVAFLFCLDFFLVTCACA